MCVAHARKRIQVLFTTEQLKGGRKGCGQQQRSELSCTHSIPPLVALRRAGEVAVRAFTARLRRATAWQNCCPAMGGNSLINDEQSNIILTFS